MVLITEINYMDDNLWLLANLYIINISVYKVKSTLLNLQLSFKFVLFFILIFEKKILFTYKFVLDYKSNCVLRIQTIILSQNV